MQKLVKDMENISELGVDINSSWNFKNGDVVLVKYEENIEYLKCITVLPEEYYEIDFEHFKCPKEKLDYIEENYKNK